MNVAPHRQPAPSVRISEVVARIAIFNRNRPEPNLSMYDLRGRIKASKIIRTGSIATTTNQVSAYNSTSRSIRKVFCRVVKNDWATTTIIMMTVTVVTAIDDQMNAVNTFDHPNHGCRARIIR